MNSRFSSKVISLIAAGMILVAPATALAQYPVEKPPQRRIAIDKFVFNPNVNQFVDNINVNQFLFLPGQEVKFKLEVKNPGDEELQNVSVSDRLPSIVTFVSGPGSYDKNSHTVNFVIDKLGKNETKSFEIKAKVKEEKDVPSNITCVTNVAEVRFDKGNMEQDSASFCIQKKVLEVVKTLPKTGPESAVLLFTMSVASSAAAVYLAKKSQ